MNAHDTVDAAIREIDNLRKVLRRGTSIQVSSRDEQNLAKATALAWFRSHFPTIRSAIGEDACAETSRDYHELLGYTDRHTSRSKYAHTIKNAKKNLSALRKFAVDGETTAPPASSTDSAPEFSALIADPKMQQVLIGRWQECVSCLSANAPLAATVMMGGLLETLLLARFNREVDKTAIFSASTAPADKKSGKTLQLKEWTLRHYLDVGHELGWVTKSTKDVGEIVRDYRNYVHPYKQVSHNVALETDDARLFWEISKEIARQLLTNAKR